MFGLSVAVLQFIVLQRRLVEVSSRAYIWCRRWSKANPMPGWDAFPFAGEQQACHVFKRIVDTNAMQIP